MIASKKLNGIENNECLKKLIASYIKKFNDEDIDILKVPARINLLGTHIDHRGGYTNYLTIDKELFCVAGKRNDSKVISYNLESEKYPPREFDIKNELPAKKINWIDFIRKIKITPGDWINYVKAPILYLQNKFPEIPLKGFNLFYYGEIPIGAGLSSSSALVVATMLCACKINNIDIEKEKLVEMCGEAEWYVGTRGGSGDHAAMIFGKKGQIVHLRFFPFTSKYLPFPENYKVICCNSLIEAKKSTDAKNIFNERIASYEIGFKLIKKNFPELKNKLVHLRDVNPEILKSEENVYKILLSIPEISKREEICKLLPEENLGVLFETHIPPEKGYRLRDILMYGISECERARICEYFLKNNEIEKFGKLMFISHDGDRVVKHLDNNKIEKWDYRVTDKYLLKLISDLKKGKEEAKIYNQPGGYRCSTPELDFIVDTTKKINGVKGAKLTGAGLGGCVLVLVEEKEAEKTLEILNKKYYHKRNLPESSFICNSSSGAEFI
ncbi:MAG TPA: galactokinase family protein [Candidatus Ratteibacteria bacterium]|nr:galactokinase family protein [bacterium]HRR96526.1 galactokinase family protein [Candidatus Ratteibacteria bacterium]